MKITKIIKRTIGIAIILTPLWIQLFMIYVEDGLGAILFILGGLITLVILMIVGIYLLIS